MGALIDFVRHLARKKAIEYEFQDIVDEAEKLFISEERLQYSALPFDEETAAIFIRLLSRRSARALRAEASRGVGKKLLKQRFDRLKEILLSVPSEMALHGVVIGGETEEIFNDELQKERMGYLWSL